MDYQEQKSPKMAAIWGEHLQALGFKPTDYNGVNHASADGVYYCFGRPTDLKMRDDALDIQLVIMGAMQHTPYEYAMMIGKAPQAPANYWVKAIGTIPAAPDTLEPMKCILYSRGIWTILLRSHESQVQPTFKKPDDASPFMSYNESIARAA